MAYFKTPVGKIPYVPKRDRVAARAQQQPAPPAAPMKAEAPVAPAPEDKVLFSVSQSHLYAFLIIVGLIIASFLGYKICMRRK
jgi:hypothetical protein